MSLKKDNNYNKHKNRENTMHIYKNCGIVDKPARRVLKLLTRSEKDMD